MNPLQTATLAELISELQARSLAGVVAIDGVSHDGKVDIACASWGDDYFRTLGLATDLVGLVMHRRPLPEGGGDDGRYTGQ